jgi:hypothetical protein
MSSTTDLFQADCGLCAAVRAARIEKATKTEEQPSKGNEPKKLSRRVKTTWDPVTYPKLNVSFVNDVDQKTKDSIISYAKEWMRPDTASMLPCISLQYQPKYDRKHEIRIRVIPKIKRKATTPGEKDEYNINQSFYGSLSVDREMEDSEASMDLALIGVPDTEDDKGVNMFRRRVLHEFGHALSFMHEQDRDDFSNLIAPTDNSADKAADAKAKPVDTTPKPVDTTTKPVDTTTKPVDTTTKPVATATKPADTTTKPTDTAAKPAVTPTEKSAMQKQADLFVNNQIVATGVADRKSIMMYPFLKVGQLTDGTTIPWNTKLSDEDKRFAKLIYPPQKK